jgi:hypothetical protein
MKDVKLDLQTAYYNLLNGNISYASVNVPVYDVMGVPQSPVYPHVLLTDWTQLDDGDKSSFGEEVTFSLEIVDRATQRGNRAGTYSVVNQIKEIIRVRPEPFNVAGWNILNTRLDNEFTLPKEFDGTYIYFGSNVRFRHTVEQLTS